MKAINYQEIKVEKQKRYDALLKECKIFWAFSNEQFMENKTELKEGEKYVSIGAGGYMPKGYVTAFVDGQKDIEKWSKNEIKQSKQEEAEIAYELCNFECYYTGSIEDVIGALPNYTPEQIQAVYDKNKKGYWANHD